MASLGPDSKGNVADILQFIRKKGATLWLDNGQLRYAAPKGALTPVEMESLRASRHHIVSLLERAAEADSAEPRPRPRARPDRVPLAFSQLAHWNLYQLQQRQAIRQVAAATKLRGQLDVDVLRYGFEQVVRRHDALRTRIVIVDGVPMQEISDSVDPELWVIDLSATADGQREAEVIHQIEKLILEPIDVASGPLFGARLLRVRDDEHVFIVAMEHIISDAFSINILLRELFAVYFLKFKGHAFSLPTVPVQFPDYAIWQRNAERSWLEKHGAYWNERLKGCSRLRFPVDECLQTGTRVGWGTVPVRVGRGLREELYQWSQRRRTTLVMAVLTAYIGLVSRWCNVSEVAIQYQTDGRVSQKVANTIGFFASPLYLSMTLREDDSFLDLINRVTEEYCDACEHADFCYMVAQVPQPEFTRNTAFNWLPQGSVNIDLSDLGGSEDVITLSPVRFEHPMTRSLGFDGEPSVLLVEADGEILGDVYFPLSRFSVDTMSRFGRNFLAFIEALLRRPEERVKNLSLI